VAISDSVATTVRRETGEIGSGFAPRAGEVAPARHAAHAGPGHDAPVHVQQPLGQSFRRRVQSRHSASAQRRDRKP
jgi:hypothetical protein